jgi:hypothetical protein
MRAMGFESFLNVATLSHHAIDVGLLAGFGHDVEAVRAMGERLLVDAIEPLAERTRSR